jgi:hypothetical protein
VFVITGCPKTLTLGHQVKVIFLCALLIKSLPFFRRSILTDLCPNLRIFIHFPLFVCNLNALNAKGWSHAPRTPKHTFLEFTWGKSHWSGDWSEFRFVYKLSNIFEVARNFSGPAFQWSSIADRFSVVGPEMAIRMYRPALTLSPFSKCWSRINKWVRRVIIDSWEPVHIYRANPICENGSV